MRALCCLSAILLLASTGPGAQRSSSPPAIVTIHRHYEPRDRETARYQYVPIEVENGIETLIISYRYNADNGASVVDIGLFEPGSLAIGTPGFRGYSGGSQSTIIVGRHFASPAYRSGPLPPGRWHVMLGLYKVGPRGVDVEIDVTQSRASAPAPASASTSHSAAAAPVEGADTSRRAAPRWFSGGLHFHTTHSDGSIDPAALASAAGAAGLEFIAITDHNNTIHTRERMPPSPLHIVGEEVTTPAGHANVWGLPPGAWIDFRVRPADADAAVSINRLVGDAHRYGALFSINHPVTDCAGCSWEQVIPDALDGVEIWNGEKGPQVEAMAIWDRLLRLGRHVTAVGASDWHRAPARIDAAAVRVLAADLTAPAILDGIRRGHVIVMRDATTAPPSVRMDCGAQSAEIGDTLTCDAAGRLTIRVSASGTAGGRAELVWNGDSKTSKPLGGDSTFELPASAGYARIHVYAADGSAIAITNPVHVAIR